MPGESPLLLAALFVLAAALGWLFARWTGRGRRDISADYFEGLNFLLNEQPDKAVEVFMRMVDVDSETIETHFALGSLFRRRGEVDRAIRVHQNIIARPGLPRVQRDKALHALADDYLKAGLLDRAETLLQQLADVPAHRKAALQGLVRIFEQQRDWEQAIKARDRLASLSNAPRKGVVAHYFCELAEEARAGGDLDATRQLLRRAQAAKRGTVRGAMMRAKLAAEVGDHDLAARLYRSVIETEPDFAVDALPPLKACFEAQGREAGFEKALQGLVRRRPQLRPGIAFAAIVHEGFDDAVTQDCVREFVESNPTLQELLELLRPGGSQPGEDAIRRISRALRRLVRGSPRYRCGTCGFAGNTLYWQCPTCKSWDTTRPITRFRFEAMLTPPSTRRDKSA